MIRGFKWLIVLVISAAMGETSQADRTALACPSSFSVAVNKELYTGWFVYSNNPLRLTGADITYSEDHEEAMLDPNDTLRLDDDRLSTVSTFRLPKTWSAIDFNLVCHYGVHAQLSRKIPHSLYECQVIQHGRFNDRTEFEFQAICK